MVKRLFKHVIANDRVIVRYLNVNESFANAVRLHVELAATRYGCPRRVETNL
jgi:hypothetical protein